MLNKVLVAVTELNYTAAAVAKHKYVWRGSRTKLQL